MAASSTGVAGALEACLRSGGASGSVALELSNDQEGFAAFTRAKNEGKNTAAPAQNSGGSIVVSLPTPLGMSLDGNAADGYFVTKVKPGSNSDKSGQVRPSLRIISVAGKSVVGRAKAEIAQSMKDAGAVGLVQIELAEDPAGYDSLLQKKEARPNAGANPAKPPVVAAATVGGDEYEDMSRLKLIKVLRERGIDYKAVAKDVDALKQLCRS